MTTNKESFPGASPPEHLCRWAYARGVGLAQVILGGDLTMDQGWESVLGGEDDGSWAALRRYFEEGVRSAENGAPSVCRYCGTMHQIAEGAPST
jgi:hypothetical protein